MRFKYLLLIYILGMWCGLAQAQPKQIHLEYEVKRDGKPFATVKEDFTQDGKTYQIQSVTKGVGIYALFGERVLTSAGDVTNEGLRPKRFELKQGDNPKKTLIADFDWTQNQLNMQVKGKLKTEPLQPGTQDLVSYPYQFIFRPPQKGAVNVTLTTGKKLNTYQYQAEEVAPQTLAGQSVNILQLDTMKGNDADRKQLWLATNLHYLLMRYQQHEDGALLEQVVTKISIQ